MTSFPVSIKTVHQPDIVIVEGLNVLQTGSRQRKPPAMFVSDFFDFTIYVDANESDIEHWYIERFLKLRSTIFQDPLVILPSIRRADGGRGRSDRSAHLADDQSASTFARTCVPTRERAHLVLEKGRDHAVRRVRLTDGVANCV